MDQARLSVKLEANTIGRSSMVLSDNEPKDLETPALTGIGRVNILAARLMLPAAHTHPGW